MLKVLVFILRLVLAGVFVAAAVGKMRAGTGGGTLYDAWLGTGLVARYAFIAFELLLAGWILSGWRPRLAATAAAIVLGFFTLLIWHESRQFAPRPCGCIGGGQIVEITPDNIRAGLHDAMTRNALLMSVALWLIVVGQPKSKTGGPPVPKI